MMYLKQLFFPVLRTPVVHYCSSLSERNCFHSQTKEKSVFHLEKVIFEVRADFKVRVLLLFFFFVIKTDFHSSAYAKNLTYVISLWLFVIYQSAVRQENSKDHSFVHKQLSWTSAVSCIILVLNSESFEAIKGPFPSTWSLQGSHHI